jgi:hypothetical protein
MCACSAALNCEKSMIERYGQTVKTKAKVGVRTQNVGRVVNDKDRHASIIFFRKKRKSEKSQKVPKIWKLGASVSATRMFSI